MWRAIRRLITSIIRDVITPCGPKVVFMLDLEMMKSVAAQMMAGKTVTIDGKAIAVQRTSSTRLRFVDFVMADRRYQAIEQNAAKPSRWAELARQGHSVVQFRDLNSGKYVAASVDGEITEYGH
jgi:hypothetical protein